jgi:hypothetical protein
MKRTIITAILLLGNLVAAQAQTNTKTYTFTDIKKPNGQTRHAAEERADAVACGMTKRFRVYDPSALQKCMLARGWAVNQITWEPPAATDAHNRALLDQGGTDAEAAPQEGAAAVGAATMRQ